MLDMLMYTSNGLIIICYLLFFLLMMFNRNKKVTNSDGFNITKDFLNEYDSINIIENRSTFTIYNIRRKVIKIASKCYYGNSLTDISIPLMEAGISITDQKKNKFINICRVLLNNLKILYVLPIIAVLINSITYNMGDAKTSIIFVSIFLIIGYFMIDIKTTAYMFIDKKIKKLKDINDDNKRKIIEYLNKIIIFDKIVFISEMIMIIRFVMILFDMN